MTTQTPPPAPATNDTIVALRAELFATLRGLNSKDKPLDIERAKAVADIAQTIINTAKVEVDMLKIVGGQGSGFVPSLPAPKTGGARVIEERPGVRVTQHKLEG